MVIHTPPVITGIIIRGGGTEDGPDAERGAEGFVPGTDLGLEF